MTPICRRPAPQLPRRTLALPRNTTLQHKLSSAWHAQRQHRAALNSVSLWRHRHPASKHITHSDTDGTSNERNMQPACNLARSTNTWRGAHDTHHVRPGQTTWRNAS
eukprot:1415390-Alexandrium_andersonii.AAC.1